MSKKRWPRFRVRNNTDRDTEFRAFKSQILKFILCSRQSHVNQNRRKR
jgi:hypothetical protein